MSNTTNTVKELSDKESKMDTSMKHQSSAMSTHSSVKGTPMRIRAWLESSVLASHVNPSVSQVRRQRRTIPETAGLKHSTLFAELDQGTACWRMLEDSYRGSTGTLKRYSKTWPRAGTMRDGKLYQLPRWEHRISETDSGLWPTPTVHGNYNRKGASKTSGDGLATAVKLWPTPTQDTADRKKKYAQGGMPLSLAVKMFPTPAARDWKDTPGMSVKRSDRTGNPRAKDQLGRAVNQNWPTICAHDHHMGYQDRHSGKKGVQKNLETVVRDGPHDQENSSTDGNPRGLLSPDWVDILMGFPAGWTDSGHLETPASPK